MPRNGSGNYELPAGNPVVSGTTITSEWANETLADVAVEIGASLSRNGEGGMLGPLRNVSGSAAVPAISFLNDAQSGLYLAGTGQIVMSVAGAPVMRWRAGTVEEWSGGAWKALRTNKFPGANPTTLSPDAALIVGTEDPVTQPHIAIGPSSIQAKSAGNNTAVLTLNPSGGSVVVGSGAGHRARFDGNTLSLRCQVAGDSPNSVAFRRWDDSLSASVGFVTGSDFSLIHHRPGNRVAVSVTSAGGTFEAMACQPDLGGTDKPGVTLDILRLKSAVNPSGTSVNHALSIGDDTANSNELRFGRYGLQTIVRGQANAQNSTLEINRLGGNILMGNTASGVSLEMQGVNGTMAAYRLGQAMWEIAPPTQGGFRVNNQLTGTGMERVLTASDGVGARTIRLSASGQRTVTRADRGATFVPTVNGVDLNLPGAAEFSADDIGFVCYAMTPTGRTLTLEAPVGVLRTFGGSGHSGGSGMAAERWAVIMLTAAFTWTIRIL